MATAPFNYCTRFIQAGNEPRPIEVADVSTVSCVFAASGASNTIFPLNEPVAFFTHEADKIAALGATGKAIDTINAVCAQGIEARCVFVRVADSTRTDPAEKATKEMTNIIGSAASMTGVHALSYARGHVGIEPHIIGGARSAGRVSNGKNPLADAVEQISEKLKAFSIFDTGGPNSTASLAYRANLSSRFSYLVDPLLRVVSGATIVVKPAAPFAGVISAMHLYPIDGAVNRRKTDAQAWKYARCPLVDGDRRRGLRCRAGAGAQAVDA
ncbi:hypothetical protein [Mesorhizobium kowhaii]|uniref:Uncharacterized protein n=1 Tax=Mesorhizobium kowhaii TaxID=1300272 RepID=A0A2W7DZU1_9HYPH|nr:hypothetical protein [Mesorhizobium kowhaii]PZV36646.1 hypothetical protein B5V02_20815 [Mesorhizobium kowhaii]